MHAPQFGHRNTIYDIVKHGRVCVPGATENCVSDYQFNDANSIQWRKSTFAEGIEVKDLGTANGRSMQLVRFAPGAAFPLHLHEGPEFIYLLEGSAFQEGQQLSAGWAAVAATGTTDASFHSPAGCVFLTVYTD
jgi:anti-sigma factor ChrR (cupin superfamily)